MLIGATANSAFGSKENFITNFMDGAISGFIGNSLYDIGYNTGIPSLMTRSAQLPVSILGNLGVSKIIGNPHWGFGSSATPSLNYGAYIWSLSW